MPDPVEHLIDEEPVARRTTVIVPPELADELGVSELPPPTHTTTTDDNDNDSVPVGAERAAQQDSDEKEVAAK